MPKKRARAQPTQAELAILDVLWDGGPSTVRQVHETLQRTRSSTTGYTTILKLMQIMAQKGLVERDESNRSHIYSPANTREATQRTLVDTLIERAFAGSASQLVLSALSARRTSAAELAEIRALLDLNEDGAERGRR